MFYVHEVNRLQRGSLRLDDIAIIQVSVALHSSRLCGLGAAWQFADSDLRSCRNNKNIFIFFLNPIFYYFIPKSTVCKYMNQSSL